MTTSLPAGAVAAGPGRIRADRPSRILEALAAIDREHPVGRKRLIGPDVNFGRELLVGLARRTGGWVGWEATNLRGVAESLAFLPLHEQGRRVAGDVEIDALVGAAIERCVAAKRLGRGFADLAHSLGFRRVLGDALLELRMAAKTPHDVERAAPAGSPARDVAPVLAEYERLLDSAKVADPAAVFATALEAFDREAPFVLDGVVVLTPTLTRRGLPGALIDRLLARGALVAAADTPDGVDAPAAMLAAGGVTSAPMRRAGDATPSTRSPLAFVAAPSLGDAASIDATLAQVDLFAAATPSDELREVARRVIGEGLRWDEVEIVATDADVYGVALDALCQQIGLGATMLRGVPFARTRLGRALARWLAWLSDGLPADTLREALEAGELGAGDAAPTALARELRALRVGWGRARWEAAAGRLQRGEPLAHMQAREGESDADFAARRESRARSCDALAGLLRALLAATPGVPERGGDRPVRASCATLASATLGWLELVPLHGPAEQQGAERLRARLGELAELDGEEPFASAMATLRDGLADLRAWPMVTSDRKPWSAAGGMPHLTDVAHAGATGRTRVFVVGLDADRTGGSGRQDPLLPDGVRRALGITTSTEWREEQAYTLAAALAGLRGRVTLSYATSATLDGREAGPSPLMLQAWRIERRDATLSYEKLRAALRPPASAVADASSGAVAHVDARDVWLAALADGPLLLDGSAVVSEAFPMLAAGLAAHDAAAAGEPGAHHGLVPGAGAELDPTKSDRPISPSALELLAKCPLAWMYRYGLSLWVPNDPEYDPERWLDALKRGSLLHEVFEAFTREYQPRQEEIVGDDARTRLLAITDEVIARWRDDEPPPSETVFEGEAAQIRRAALAFLQMERERLGAGDRGKWLAFELPLDGAASSAYEVGDGTSLRTRGRVDRVDELPDGTLRVVDYKTGSAGQYLRGAKTAPFNGGRQLQPALYAAAVEAMQKKPVASFEYRFPTEKGGNETVAYAAPELESARPIVRALLDHVRAGEFVPTTDAGDCGYCDYQSICRATRDGYGKATSPRAEWGEANAERLPVYTTMIERRKRRGAE